MKKLKSKIVNFFVRLVAGLVIEAYDRNVKGLRSHLR
jgi:hypothetical protein